MPVVHTPKVIVRPGGLRRIPEPPGGIFVAKDNPLVGLTNPSAITPVGSLQTNTTYDVGGSNRTIRNLEFFGTVFNGSYTNTTLENCILHGTLARGVLNGVVQSNNDNHRGLTLRNCLVQGRADLGTDTTGTWGPIGRPLSNEWLNGLRGGNYNIYYCEFKSLTDYFSFTGYNSGGIYRLDVTIDASWIHDGFFNEWTKAEFDSGYYPYAGSYYTHVDGVQFHRGKGATITRSYFGGVKRGNYNHHATPSQKNLINADDDLFNAGILIKQEEGGAAKLIEDILIEWNIFEGGKSCFNIVSSDPNDPSLANKFSTTIVRNNYFVRALPGVSQIYMLNGPNIGVIYDNFMYNETDANGNKIPVPISRGF